MHRLQEGEVAEARCPGLALRLNRRAEAAPRCALLWSAENAAGAKRDRRLQVRGAGGVPKGLTVTKALSAGPPKPLNSFDELIPIPLPGGAYPRPGDALPPLSQLSLGLRLGPGTRIIKVARRARGYGLGKGKEASHA